MLINTLYAKLKRNEAPPARVQFEMTRLRVAQEADDEQREDLSLHSVAGKSCEQIVVVWLILVNQTGWDPSHTKFLLIVIKS